MATKRNALAWMKFDPLIVAGEVDGMTVAQQGAYFILIRHLWPKGPMPEADIRRYIREHTAAIMPTLAQYGDGWSMPWLEEAREEASAVSNSQRDRAIRGWEKRSPGNAPAMPRQAPASPGNAEEKERRGEREQQREEEREKRLAAFRARCLEVHDREKILTNPEAKKFFEYWTERSPDAKKHRWEFERTFDITRRMRTWSGNVKAPVNADGKVPFAPSTPEGWNPRA